MLRGILIDILDMDEADLRTLNHAAITQLKALRSRKTAINRHAFKEGDQVTFKGRAGNMIGTVKRVKRKKAIIDTGELRCWDVPLGMLALVAGTDGL